MWVDSQKTRVVIKHGRDGEIYRWELDKLGVKEQRGASHKEVAKTNCRTILRDIGVNRRKKNGV